MGLGLPFCSTEGFSVTATGVSSCVSNTICTYIPFVFLVISSSLRLKKLPQATSLSFNPNADSFLRVLKRCCTVLLALVPVAACTDVFRDKNYKELKGHQSIALIVASFLKTTAWSLSYFVMKREDACGAGQSLNCIRGFWFLSFACSTVTSLSAIPQLEGLASPTQLLLACGYFGLTAVLACIGACYKTCSVNDFSIYGDDMNAGFLNNASKYSSIQSSSRVALVDSDQARKEFLKINGKGDNEQTNFLDTSIDDGTFRKGRRSFDNFTEIEGFGDSARSPYTGGYHTTRDGPEVSGAQMKDLEKRSRSTKQKEIWKRFKQETTTIDKEGD